MQHFKAHFDGRQSVNLKYWSYQIYKSWLFNPLGEVIDGQYSIIVASPEVLCSEQIGNTLVQLKKSIKVIAVDEVHVVPSW